ncbi:hypothetical protein BDN71DRAFT_1430603 [Pleurotus eryngii]|uniref:Uncharacterized protein n=1 Tax=Pleurotus eryngii TaxID=5323 RepID=A0A9P6D7L3_PLEER|nr:hypothetical protein BDN71DRAFT_1430603 [Pleurotus eryngii]
MDEVCGLQNGQLIIPIQWVIYHDEVHANAYLVVCQTNEDWLIIEKGEAHTFVQKDEPLLISASQLQDNYHDLEHGNLLPNWSKGKPLYSSLVDIFRNNVSGNQLKSWNKHWNIIPEQFMGVSDVVKSTHCEPVRVCDAMSGEMMWFQIYINAKPGDNPMQSEVCSHIESGRNYYCCKCKADGTQKEHEQDEGYHALFQPGAARSGPKTLAGIKKQVQLACAGVVAAVNEFQMSTGIKDPYTQFWSDPSWPCDSKEIEKELLQWVTEHESDIVNGLLTLPDTDLTKDTPVEILHTGLFGIVKYVWYASHTMWILRAICQLIGRQLKTLSQTAIFHIHDLVDIKTFTIWKAVGNVLDVFATSDPSKILTNIKLHLLTHLDEDVYAFGPLVRMATENYEAFNAIFQFCSVLSNHLALSCDITHQLTSQEGVKHLMLVVLLPGTSKLKPVSSQTKARSMST